MEKKLAVSEKSEAAKAYFRQGYNCCQSVILAFSDIITKETGMSKEAMLNMSATFGGGIGGMREVCGTVSAIAMIVGLLSPSKNPDNPPEKEEKMQKYNQVKELANKFRDENGSIICKDLLMMIVQQKENHKSSEEQRTPRIRSCEQYVGDSAKIIAEYIAETL